MSSTLPALRRILAHCELRCWHPRPADVGLTAIEADALVHRGLVVRVRHGRLVLSASGFERVLMGEVAA